MYDIILVIFFISLGLHLVWGLKYTGLVAGISALVLGVLLLVRMV